MYDPNEWTEIQLIDLYKRIDSGTDTFILIFHDDGTASTENSWTVRYEITLREAQLIFFFAGREWNTEEVIYVFHILSVRGHFRTVIKSKVDALLPPVPEQWYNFMNKYSTSWKPPVRQVQQAFSSDFPDGPPPLPEKRKVNARAGKDKSGPPKPAFPGSNFDDGPPPF